MDGQIENLKSIMKMGSYYLNVYIKMDQQMDHLELIIKMEISKMKGTSLKDIVREYIKNIVIQEN